MITFNHSGSLGDVIFSLYMCKELVESEGESEFNFHIQTCTDQYRIQTGGMRNGCGLTVSMAEFIKPLLESQDYINQFTYSPQLPEGSFNLDLARKINLNTMGGDLRGWWYNLVGKHLPREFYKPILKVEPNYKFKDKILFSWSGKYCNLLLDYKTFEQFNDHFVFIGLEEEFEEFNSKFFKMKEYIKVNDMLEAAQYIAGAKGFIGSEGGLFTLAECIKVPRILLSPEIIHFRGQTMFGPFNVPPIGGWNEAAGTNDKAICSMKELINKKD